MDEMMKPKRKQKMKKGKVVRLSPETWYFITFHRLQGETIAGAVERLLQPPIPFGRSYYILPEAGIAAPTKAEAKGAAIVNAVKRGWKTVIEEPIEVREVL